MRPTPTFNMKPAPSMKQLSWDEMQKRRIQGLCFNCDEKFTPGHGCKGPLLLLLLKRMKKGPMMIQRIHFMLSQDQLNLHKLKDLFINLNLEDKVPPKEKGNDGR